MKKILTMLLAAAMLFGVATGASAIDFKAKGQWRMGFSGGEMELLNKRRAPDGQKENLNNNDKFNAMQWVRLQMDAVASEALSGVVFFEIGKTNWGRAGQGGALGADGTMVKVKRAYLDWVVPETALKFRMGLQGIATPNKAGGTAILDSDVAGITASYQFNDNAGITFFWARPFNDNYSGDNTHGVNSYQQNYLDNIDLFSLLVPIKLEGFEVTPWVMYGVRGKNSLKNYGNGWSVADGDQLQLTLLPYTNSISNRNNGNFGLGNTSKAYGSMFWAGLPFAINAWDPLNIEVDLNYGHVEGMGRYDAYKGLERTLQRGSSERQGWLAKALVEYKMDWGVPGIFGWYASGDDGNVKNGSERMPSLVPMGNFTSFLGDGSLGWHWQDFGLDYAGTWGVGLHVRDMSFVENLSHTFRIAYWGGTNSTSMIKYMDTAYAWNTGWGSMSSPYLTTSDGLLEFNLVNNYKIYENLDANFELGYIANFIDNSTWKKAGMRNTSFEKQDAWKAQVVFTYSF